MQFQVGIGSAVSFQICEDLGISLKHQARAFAVATGQVGASRVIPTMLGGNNCFEN